MWAGWMFGGNVNGDCDVVNMSKVLFFFGGRVQEKDCLCQKPLFVAGSVVQSMCSCKMLMKENLLHISI